MLSKLFKMKIPQAEFVLWNIIYNDVKNTTLYINNALKNFKHKSKFPYNVFISISFTQEHPDENTLEFLELFEDFLHEIFKKNNVEFLHVLKTTKIWHDESAFLRELDFYVNDYKKTENILSEVKNSNKFSIDFSHIINKDKNWENVEYYLKK